MNALPDAWGAKMPQDTLKGSATTQQAEASAGMALETPLVDIPHLFAEGASETASSTRNGEARKEPGGTPEEWRHARANGTPAPRAFRTPCAQQRRRRI